MSEWMVVAVFFLYGVPVQADSNLVDPAKASTEAECKALIPAYTAAMKERFGFETVAECQRVFPAPPEPPKIIPHDKKSEVAS